MKTKKLQSNKQESKLPNSQEGVKIQPGQDLFRQGLEQMLGQEISQEEADELDQILSGNPTEDEEELQEPEKIPSQK